MCHILIIWFTVYSAKVLYKRSMLISRNAICKVFDTFYRTQYLVLCASIILQSFNNTIKRSFGRNFKLENNLMLETPFCTDTQTCLPFSSFLIIELMKVRTCEMKLQTSAVV